jgi:molecular chaperone GrpE
MSCSCENDKTAELKDINECSEESIPQSSDEKNSVAQICEENKDYLSVISQKNAEIAQLKEQILRARADFDNYRKRCIKNEEQNKKMSVKDIALDIISINDNLIRACDAAAHIKEGETIEQSHHVFVEGVQMISKSIEQTLQKNGIEEIDAFNCPFNPMIHEAIEFDSSEDVKEDMVTKVHQKGYKIDSLVIRTAKVKVTKPFKKEDVSSASQETDISTQN